jgi:hypothetical protein
MSNADHSRILPDPLHNVRPAHPVMFASVHGHAQAAVIVPLPPGRHVQALSSIQQR